MVKCKTCKTANGNKARDNLCKNCFDTLQKDDSHGGQSKLPEIPLPPADLPDLPEGWADLSLD